MWSLCCLLSNTKETIKHAYSIWYERLAMPEFSLAPFKNTCMQEASFPPLISWMQFNVKERFMHLQDLMCHSMYDTCVFFCTCIFATEYKYCLRSSNPLWLVTIHSSSSNTPELIHAAFHLCSCWKWKHVIYYPHSQQLLASPRDGELSR